MVDNKNKGFCVISERLIEKGEFICQYLGKCMRSNEWKELNKDFTYALSFNIDSKNNFIIDAKYAGNIARYISHSCDPNLFA